MPQRTIRMRFSQSTQRINKMVHSAFKTGKHLYRLTRTSQAPKSFFKSYLSFVVFIIGISLCLFLLISVRIDSYKFGYRVVELKKEKNELDERMQTLKAEHAHLRSHTYLLQMNKARGLYLEPPQEWMLHRKP